MSDAPALPRPTETIQMTDRTVACDGGNGPLGHPRRGRAEVTLGMQLPHRIDDCQARAVRPGGAAVRRLAIAVRPGAAARRSGGGPRSRHDNHQVSVEASAVIVRQIQPLAGLEPGSAQ